MARRARIVPSPFATLAHDPEAHFVLCIYGSLVAALECVPAAAAKLPAGYRHELEGVAESRSRAAWRAARHAWQAASAVRLPIAALCAGAELDDDALDLLFAAALPDEDARFCALFEALGGRPLPTVGALAALAGGPAAAAELRRLADRGLIVVAGGEEPRTQHVVRLAPGIADALRGDAAGASWAGYVAPSASLAPILEPEARAALERLPAVLADGVADTVVVRGPATSGRRTLLGSLARSLGLGVLTFGEDAIAAGQWRTAGAMAHLLGALPVAILAPAPSEAPVLEALPGYDGPLGVVLPRTGSLSGPRAERAVTIELGLPSPSARAAHWDQAFEGVVAPPAAALAARHRMTGGNIRRTATLARAEAALAGRAEVTHGDVRAATRTLHGRLLDALAERVAPARGWEDLAVPEATARELALLADRCRRREALREALGGAGPSAGAGVRALLSGPSGTGKTLAARALAAELERDIYRVDLAAIVDKYIGETEKNLAEIFARAEEADAALLLDEGDALLTRRTAVTTAHDRYANLETNYLLQRLETFEGVLVVTTNASDRIDGAFRRRMDVVIDFPAPDPRQRWAIWNVHLPARHAVDAGLLEDVAARCSLNGGQIRNAVVHAALLSLSREGIVGSAELEQAVRREYRKNGRVCPLPALNGSPA